SVLTISNVLVSYTWMMLSSLVHTISHLPSFDRMTPRGRWPTGNVLITSSFSVSMTDTELSFSLVANAVKAMAAGAGRAQVEPMPSNAAMTTLKRIRKLPPETFLELAAAGDAALI